MNRVTTARALERPRYQFKVRPLSSHRLLLDEFPLQSQGRRVLDIGCASGYLAARGYLVTGVDRPGTPYTEIIGFAGADLDTGLLHLEGCFDFILCADVLEHLRDPLRLLRECCARLAPNGTLIASLPNTGNLYFRWNVLLGCFPRHELGLFDRTDLHFYVWQGWSELLAGSDFRIQAVQVSGVPVGLALPHWDGSAAVRMLEWASFRLARAWKTLFAYQFIVRARAEDVE
jgi:O-antigen biosynthesis protein